MLSKEDFKRYLEQAEALESNMLCLYKRCKNIVEDESVREIFHHLLKSELDHDRAIKKSIKLINE